MSYRLYIRPRPSGPVPGDTGDEERLFNWVLLDASGDEQAHGSDENRHTIEQTLIRNDLEGVRLTALIPGDQALFCFADIPARQARFVQQALPYAVEEQIAQDIDSVHLALGPREEAGYRVAAIDRDRMTQWQALFSGWQQASLEAIYPDAALLPVENRDWSICFDEPSRAGDPANVLVASNRGEWFRMFADNLAMFAQTLALPPEDTVVTEVGVQIFGTQAMLDSHQGLIAQLQGHERLRVSQHPIDLMPLALLAHAHHQNLCHPINLCQNGFALTGDGNNRLRPWYPAIAVACLWFVLQVGVEIGLGIQAQSQAHSLQQQAMQSYRTIFPEDTGTHTGNLRRVLEGQLRQQSRQGPSADFLTLLGRAGLEYEEASAEGRVRFNTVNFSRSRGELVIDLRADSYERLNAIRNGLNSQGMEASIGSVVNESDGARGRLTLSGG